MDRLLFVHLLSISFTCGLSVNLDRLYQNHVFVVNKNSPPSNDFDLSVSAQMAMLIDFDENKDTLSTVVHFTLMWTDERYSWNGLDVSDIPPHLRNYLIIDDDLVWRPFPFIYRDQSGGAARIHKLNVSPSYLVELYPYEGKRTNGFIFAKDVEHGLLVQGVIFIMRNGTLRWIFSKRLDTYCEADTTFYPFDNQYCMIELTFPDYPNMNVKLADEERNITNERNMNGNWEITKYDVFHNDKYIAISLELQRKPFRPILTLILPVFVLASMAPLVFILPKDSGDRIGLSLTTLLAISVYMTIIGESIPKVSDPIAIIHVILFLWFISNGCIVLLVIINNKMYNVKDSVAVPRTIQKMVLYIRKCRCRVRKREKCVEDSTESKNMNVERCDNDEDHDATEALCQKVTWRELSHILDLLFFCSIYLMKFVFFFIVLIYLLNGSRLSAGKSEAKRNLFLNAPGDPVSPSSFDYYNYYDRRIYLGLAWYLENAPRGIPPAVVGTTKPTILPPSSETTPAPSILDADAFISPTAPKTTQHPTLKPSKISEPSQPPSIETTQRPTLRPQTEETTLSTPSPERTSNEHDDHQQ